MDREAIGRGPKGGASGKRSRSHRPSKDGQRLRGSTVGGATFGHRPKARAQFECNDKVSCRLGKPSSRRASSFGRRPRRHRRRRRQAKSGEDQGAYGEDQGAYGEDRGAKGEGKDKRREAKTRAPTAKTRAQIAKSKTSKGRRRRVSCSEAAKEILFTEWR